MGPASTRGLAGFEDVEHRGAFALGDGRRAACVLGRRHGVAVELRVVRGRPPALMATAGRGGGSSRGIHRVAASCGERREPASAADTSATNGAGKMLERDASAGQIWRRLGCARSRSQAELRADIERLHGGQRARARRSGLANPALTAAAPGAPLLARGRPAADVGSAVALVVTARPFPKSRKNSRYGHGRIKASIRRLRCLRRRRGRARSAAVHI